MEVLPTTDFEVQDFQREVIEKSYDKPVLVDFWAPWCGPCKMISPLLEKAYQQFGGKFILAKVNVDHHQSLAQQYQVRGIPACQLFMDGKVVDAFTGVIPEKALRSFLEKYVPNERKLALRDVQQLIQDGNTAGAIEQLEQMLTEHDDSEVRLLLAKTLLPSAPGKASNIVQDITADDEHYAQAQGVMVLAQVLLAAEDPTSLPDNGVKGMIVAAGEALSQQDYDTALSLLIDSIIKHKAYEDELARKACIAIFDHLGRQHPITVKYRRKFDMSLY